MGKIGANVIFHLFSGSFKIWPTLLNLYLGRMGAYLVICTYTERMSTQHIKQELILVISFASVENSLVVEGLCASSTMISILYKPNPLRQKKTLSPLSHDVFFLGKNR